MPRNAPVKKAPMQEGKGREAIVGLNEDLPDAAIQEVVRAAASIDFNDPSLSLAYGAGAMNSIASFADDLLQRVRAKDAGPLGDMLSNLLLQVKSVDTEFLLEAQPPKPPAPALWTAC